MFVMRIVASSLLLWATWDLRPCAAEIRFTGVNLFGAEFGVSDGNLNLPGTYGQHYIYPSAAEVDYFVGQGMNTFRLPFRWERLQRTLYANLDGQGPGPVGELDRIDAFVDAATAAGAYVILDPHNFQRYQPAADDFESSPQGLVGSSVSYLAYAIFWARVADHYKTNQHVFFNLMNEPNTMPTAELVTAHNVAIAAIRQTGARNLILVPGNQWTGAWTWNATWYQGANAAHMLNIVDPANNFAFDVHQYFDADGSGTSAEITGNNSNIGVERLTAFTNWLHAHDRKGFLGEFALAESRFGSGVNQDGPQIGDETLTNMLSFMEANDDVWLGWTWWAAGPWFTNYMFSLEPENLGQPGQLDSPVLPVLRPYFANAQPGDANFDDQVNAADYTVWRNTFGETGAGLASDFNIDGIVNKADHAIWRANFGASGAAGAVPEPDTLALVVAAYLLHFPRWRRKETLGPVVIPFSKLWQLITRPCKQT